MKGYNVKESKPKKRAYKTGFTSAISFSMDDGLYLNIVGAASKKDMRPTDWIRMILLRYFEIIERREK